MNLIFFTHPDFLGNKSMLRFGKLLSEGMAKRGHQVEAWSPPPVLSHFTKRPSIQKWLAYYDLYVSFPRKIKRMLKGTDANTLFVFTDQSLGLWVPIVADRPCVVHCHDFLALRSANGEIDENPTSWSGRFYQRLILKGFSKVKNFISVSKKTREDLHKLALTRPNISEVVYNGLHQSFVRHDTRTARDTFGKRTGLDLSGGYVLHVGGNQWYKNRNGVVDIYDAWRALTQTPQPLLLVGAPLSDGLQQRVNASKYRSDIHCLTSVSDDEIGRAYAGASVFLFPSLGEGFGWPIAEAMASGTLVVTTGEVPMSEVAGDAGFLIPRMPANAPAAAQWAKNGGETIERIMKFSPEEREQAIQKGIANSRRFDTDSSLNQIEAIYKRVLQSSLTNG